MGNTFVPARKRARKERVPVPWKERSVPDERLRFVIACLEGADSMAALCRRFGVSRRVGYKWLSRYKDLGPAGLAERSRAPLTSPNKVAAAVERRILSMRADHPTWGARKLLVALARRGGGGGSDADVDWPAASTVGEIIRRAGLVASSQAQPVRVGAAAAAATVAVA